MVSHRIALAWATCLVVLAAGCSGCTGREESAGEEPDADISEMEFPVGAHTLELRGEKVGRGDFDNRYPSAVQVWVRASPGQQPYPQCVGVVLASNLVLTAAHCLCTPSRGETTRFDRSGCAAEGRVIVQNWPAFVNGAREGNITEHHGDILVHPWFQIVLDAQGAIVTSRADLAVIRLKEPVPSDIPPIRLARGEVKAGEIVTVVGFVFFPGENGGMGDVKRFSREEVRAPADGERLLFGPVDRAGIKGDMGGPCVRETKAGMELVGVSQRGLGLAPAFTRIAPYRAWLEEQIQLANAKR